MDLERIAKTISWAVVVAFVVAVFVIGIAAIVLLF